MFISWYFDFYYMLVSPSIVGLVWHSRFRHLILIDLPNIHNIRGCNCKSGFEPPIVSDIWLSQANLYLVISPFKAVQSFNAWNWSSSVFFPFFLVLIFLLNAADSVDTLMAETHELEGSTVVVDRATPKATYQHYRFPCY